MDERIKNTVVLAAKEAGKILMQNFGRHYNVRVKEPREIVSDIDLKAEKKILSILRKNYPQYNILSEEFGKERKKSESTWIIDPLDGTTNYTIRNPFFDISIALANGNEVVVGCVYAPVTNELFYAEKGKGAFLNGKRIKVSNIDSISKSLLTFCNGKSDFELERITRIFKELKPHARDFNQMRAGALELAFVAAGRVEAYISNGGKPWDAAAGSLLVKEAGGMATDFSGKGWVFDFDKEICDILASNKKIHKEILKIVNKL